MSWVIFAVAATFVVVVVARLLMMRTGCRVLTTDLRLSVPGLAPDLAGTRVAVLSDLHVGRLHVPLDRLYAAVEAAGPDLLLMVGDYAAGAQVHDRALDVVKHLAAAAPAFGVMGNTDYNQGLDPQVLGAALRGGGGDLLINEARRHEISGAMIEVLGVDDPLCGAGDAGATARTAGDNADLRLGICHSPAIWQQLPELDAHLTLVGHTHGGQVRFFGTEAQATHLTYPRELAAGLFRLEDDGERPTRLASHWQIVRGRRPLEVSASEGRLLYVTRGVGMGVLPLRVGCPPEVLVIELTREEPTEEPDDG